MYESPIKTIQGELEMQLEGEILKAARRVDVTVDRDELIRALRYDREQYQKGFADARKDAVVVTRCKDCKYSCNDENGRTCEGYWYELSEYAVPVKDDSFCSYGQPKEGAHADDHD